MNLTELTAISPIDGRYRSRLKSLSNYFSEQALIRYRLLVEVEYFIALTESGIKELAGFPKDKIDALRNIYLKFSEKEAARIKEIEKRTNHDVKAVEYFLKEEFDRHGLQAWREFIHFGLTSQDINNTATPLIIKDFTESVYFPSVKKLDGSIQAMAVQWKDVAMLARTHGQPASPTRLGKEIRVFSQRINAQLSTCTSIPHTAKFGGATGNFNAHLAAYPTHNWPAFADGFITRLGLSRQQITTQIEHYDMMASLFHNMARINTILIDFARDIWTYISMEYFKQKIIANEVGSSAMPHKVNPIDFENAEGNLGLANALFNHLAAKLPISRLQRDLTDSTVTRNIGVPIAHTMLAIHSLENGLKKLTLNKKKIDRDLEENWIVVAEGIQNILRREAFKNPYEALKKLTRNNSIPGEKEIRAFIIGLEVSDKVKQELLALSPFNYTGV